METKVHINFRDAKIQTQVTVLLKASKAVLTPNILHTSNMNFCWVYTLLFDGVEEVVTFPEPFSNATATWCPSYKRISPRFKYLSDFVYVEVVYTSNNPVLTNRERKTEVVEE